VCTFHIATNNDLAAFIFKVMMEAEKSSGTLVSCYNITRRHNTEGLAFSSKRGTCIAFVIELYALAEVAIISVAL
jgi:hypothetical protein